ncbi:MAG: PIN domain-containing protein [Gemmatimonadota bacterium]
MSAPIFVDTNLLVYVRDAAGPEKQQRAAGWMRYLWQERLGRVSTQVLNEYYVTVTQKLTPGLSREAAREDVRQLFAWDPIVPDVVILDAAFAVQDRFGFSWWDSLIVSAAQASGCDTLLSEDMQDGQDLSGVLVVNPFGTAPPRT